MMLRVLLSITLTLGALAASLSAADPGQVRRAGWHESMLASRDAIRAREPARAADAAPLWFASDIVRGGGPARLISVPIAGWKELNLYVIGAPEIVYGAANWADARLVDADRKITFAGQARGIRLIEGQMSIDSNLHSGVSGPLKIAGRQFERGIHAYPNGISKITIPLDKAYAKFEAFIGIDDWVGKRGAVRFIVAGPEGAARVDLWESLSLEFADARSRCEMKWERQDRTLEDDWTDFRQLALRYAEASRRVPPLAVEAAKLAADVKDAPGLEAVRKLYIRSRELDAALIDAHAADFTALRLAVEDLGHAFPERYSGAAAYLKRVGDLDRLRQDLSSAFRRPDAPPVLADYERIEKLVADFRTLQREALLANPLLDFEQLLLIRRTPHGDPRMPHGTGYSLGEYIGLPRQTSKHNPDIDEHFNWDNEIAVLSPVRPEGRLTTLYKPDGRKLITDVDLHWDANRMLFSMPGTQRNWQIFEMGIDGQKVRQVTPGDQPDVHNYDACYLPSGKIAFLSTACLQGVPCNAGVIVGMLYRMNADGSGIRQIAFEQDHDYCPTVTNDGRLMYLRWDYTDTPHVWNRMLFTMNPDGTEQQELYGAQSYWPNAIFYARPIPNHRTKIVGIVTGHHVGRVGELVIFDPSKGRFEADGVVQRIPGRGQKVEPLIQDKLTEHSWPKFLHPYPLSEQHFIVSCKPTPDSLWGIYLVDVFDNMVLLKELEGQALVEPIPVRKVGKPPAVPDRVDPKARESFVYMQNVYEGVPMKGIPRGAVKSMRVFTYHFGYQRLAGIDHRVGADGPWEAKRILGTVKVEEDGSAFFNIPPKTPFSVQPLDAEGKAVQLMRTWMTAMPGETLSCVGCHDNRNTAALARTTRAFARGPEPIAPWYGPPRGFSFKREVQPVLDKHCVSCHDGQPRDGQRMIDLRGEQGFLLCYKGGDPQPTISPEPMSALIGRYGGIFTPSYMNLRRLVRVGGLESDLHFLTPMDFHADTTHLFQLLKKGHYGVELDAEAWDRLATWIDLNAPAHATWSDFCKIVNDQRQRRQYLRKLYGGVDEDPEEDLDLPLPRVQMIAPKPTAKRPDPMKLEGWPLILPKGAAEVRTFELGNGVKLELVKIPAGRFVMGDVAGYEDEFPQAAITIDSSFWMGRFEVTNQQYALFDPAHDSRFEHRSSWIFSEEYLGWLMNGPNQPVVRVSWQRANEYCQWLSQKTGLKFSLPTEAQWEWACRAGGDAPLSYGNLDADFSKFANLADKNIRKWAYEGWRPRSPDMYPRDDRFDDGHFVTADVGRYQPNAFGLHDMHGNAAEWTRSLHKPYPYADADGRNDPAAAGHRSVRGGSWFDRPMRARSSFRQSYEPWQRIFNVGFRVVCEEAK